MVGKERPHCRERILELLKEGHTLDELIVGEYRDNENRKVFMTKGLRVQARKMLYELKSRVTN